MTNLKLCPFRFESLESGKIAKIKCVKEDCAWWIERSSYHHKQGCSMKILALSMDIFVSEQKRFIMAMEKHR